MKIDDFKQIGRPSDLALWTRWDWLAAHLYVREHFIGQECSWSYPKIKVEKLEFEYLRDMGSDKKGDMEVFENLSCEWIPAYFIGTGVDRQHYGAIRFSDYYGQLIDCSAEPTCLEDVSKTPDVKFKIFSKELLKWGEDIHEHSLPYLTVKLIEGAGYNLTGCPVVGTGVYFEGDWIAVYGTDETNIYTLKEVPYEDS